jgi:hypothetical protein
MDGSKFPSTLLFSILGKVLASAASEETSLLRSSLSFCKAATNWIVETKDSRVGDISGTPGTDELT